MPPPPTAGWVGQAWRSRREVNDKTKGGTVLLLASSKGQNKENKQRNVNKEEDTNKWETV